jgi:hypothetical protein
LYFFRSSSAKNVGTTLAEVSTDKDGVTRPQESVYEIGAYEFVPAGDVTPPIISAITVNSILDVSANITWTTNEQADSQVEYGLTTGYGTSTTLDATLVTANVDHMLRVPGLRVEDWS